MLHVVGLTAVLSLSMAQPSRPAPETCVVEARVPSYAGQAFRIQGHASLHNGWKGVVLADGVVSPDGEFRARISVSEHEVVTLYVGRTFRQLWLEPGTLTIREGTPWTFEGSAALENETLAAVGLNRPGAFSPPVTADYVAFTEAVRERERERNDTAHALLGTDPGPFRTYVDAQILGDALHMLSIYPIRVAGDLPGPAW